MCAEANMLSKCHRDLCSISYGTTPCDSASRELSPNLYDKPKYLVHIANLQLYINMGVM